MTPDELQALRSLGGHFLDEACRLAAEGEREQRPQAKQALEDMAKDRLAAGRGLIDLASEVERLRADHEELRALAVETYRHWKTQDCAVKALP